MDSRALVVVSGCAAVALATLALLSLDAEPRPAVVLEADLERSYRSFSRQVRAISPGSPDYWRRVWMAYKLHRLDEKWREFSTVLHNNAVDEGQRETGAPE